MAFRAHLGPKCRAGVPYFTYWVGSDLDERLLLTLASVVCVALHSVAADDREQHVVANTGGSFCGDQVACRGAELTASVTFPRRRVHHVHDGINSGEDRRHPNAGGEVEAV